MAPGRKRRPRSGASPRPLRAPVSQRQPRQRRSRGPALDEDWREWVDHNLKHARSLDRVIRKLAEHRVPADEAVAAIRATAERRRAAARRRLITLVVTGVAAILISVFVLLLVPGEHARRWPEAIGAASTGIGLLVGAAQQWRKMDAFGQMPREVRRSTQALMAPRFPRGATASAD